MLLHLMLGFVTSRSHEGLGTELPPVMASTMTNFVASFDCRTVHDNPNGIGATIQECFVSRLNGQSPPALVTSYGFAPCATFHLLISGQEILPHARPDDAYYLPL